MDAQNHDPISLYINTPGGDVLSGLAIYDTIKLLKSPVKTICIGLAASMGSIILCAGTERLMLPHSKVLIHQPWGGIDGQTTDLVIAVKQIEHEKQNLIDIIASTTGQPKDKVATDVERDFWLDSKSAIEYGIVHKILK